MYEDQLRRLAQHLKDVSVRFSFDTFEMNFISTDGPTSIETNELINLD